MQCQNIVTTLSGEERRCAREATHRVESIERLPALGLPGASGLPAWSGVHCDVHTQDAVLHYDHQGGCNVRTL